MKTIISTVVVLLFCKTLFAQILNPVEWYFSSKKIADKTYEIHLTANVDEGWHIYSQNTPDGGPVPTSITFAKNPLIQLQGVAKEVGKMEKHHEPLFGVDVKQFSSKVDFVQTVVVKVNAKTSLNGTVTFMLCNNKECLPPATQKFSISLK